MICRNIISLIFIFGAAVIATVQNDPHSVTGSGPEVTDHHLTTEYPESSTREPEQQVMETAAADLGALLDAGDGAVITLVAGDTRLAAHRAVLVHRSPVFAATLHRVTLETSGGELVIRDVEGPVLRQLLAYTYTLRAPQLPGMAPQLLAAADAYGLSALKAHCEQQVAAQLSVETAAAAAVLAVKHSSASLRQAAISFIKAHILQVMATRGWADAVNSQPEEFMKVMRLLFEAPEEASSSAVLPGPLATQCLSVCSTPAPATSGAAPTTLPDSDHSGPTPASAAPTTAAPNTPTPDYPAVCPLWSLSAHEKNLRLRLEASHGTVQQVEALLAAGADVGAGDQSGQTALHWAAGGGHVEAARRLLAAGVAVDARDRWLRTPLHYAARWGHAAVARLLVEEASADVNARDVDGWTPLHWAAIHRKAGAAAMLLQAGADRAAADNEGRTPLDIARENNRQQLVDMLTASS